MFKLACKKNSPCWLPWLIATIGVLTIYRGLVIYLGHLDLYVDEAQYWTWAKHLAWGYFSKPPVIALLIALTTVIGGNGVFWVKCGTLLCYPLSSLLIYALTKRLFDARIAFWSAVAFLLLPGVSFSSMIISTDVPFFVFWCMALYGYWRALEDNKWRWWLTAGIAGGLGLQTKYTMVLFLLSVCLHLASSRKLRPQFRNPKLYVATAIAALIFLPNLIWNAENGWPTLNSTISISHLGSNPGLHWQQLGDFFAAQFAVMGPVFFSTWVWLTLWKPKTWWSNSRLRYLALFAIPFLGVICAQALAGRANANWGAMTYASATIFITALLFQNGRKKIFFIGLILNLFLMPVAYHFDWWTHAAGIQLNAHTDPYKRVRGWSQLAANVRKLMNRYPNAIILGDTRAIVAELMYYDRPQADNALQWNPTDAVMSQYTLHNTLANKRGRTFLYITKHHRLPKEVLRSFASTKNLGSVAVKIYKDYSLNYEAWLLVDFHGYAGRPTNDAQTENAQGNVLAIRAENVQQTAVSPVRPRGIAIDASSIGGASTQLEVREMILNTGIHGSDITQNCHRDASLLVDTRKNVHSIG